jgi:hypothetical protein
MSSAKPAGGTAIISGLGSAALEFGAAASTATKFAVGTTGQLILADSAYRSTGTNEATEPA